jgi:hypothetical protein
MESIYAFPTLCSAAKRLRRGLSAENKVRRRMKSTESMI